MECTMYHDTKWGDKSLQQSVMPGKHSGHWFKKINSTYGSHLIFITDTDMYETLEIFSCNVTRPRIHKVIFPS